MAIEIVTPPGRIVWGHPLQKGIKTDPKTKKAILDKEGKEQDVWACGLAIPVAQFAPIEAAIAQVAYQLYPQGNFPRDFAWKIKRETDRDEQNKLYAEREGYAGHVVLNISTQAFCPPAFKFENNQYRQLTEKDFKCGDWVSAKLSIAGHPGGVYINPMGFELIGYDKEIVRRNAFDPTQAFGGRAHQLPPGVSATPVGGAPTGMAPPVGAYNAPGAMVSQPVYQPTAYPASVASQPVTYQAPVTAAPVQMPAPAHDFVNNAMGIPTAQPAAYHPAAPVNYGAPGQPAGIPGIPQGR